jgi:hypothetical protein
MAGIFVSHAARDQELAEAVVELLQLGSGVPADQIFFASGPGMRVPTGSRFNEYIRGEVEDASLVVAILSPAFRESAFSIAEVGAAWVMQGNFFPLTVPDFGHRDLEGVLIGVQVQSLDDPQALAELHDRVCEALGLGTNTTRWAKQQAKFLARLGDLMTRLDGPRMVGHDQLEAVERERDGAQSALGEAESEKRALEERFEALRIAKTKEEAVAATAPADQEAQFDELRSRARDALGELPRAVQSAIAFHVRGEEMPIPSRWEDQYGAEEVVDALREGYLEEGTAETVTPATDIRLVESALEAVTALQNFFAESTEEFDEHFKERFGAPPDLRKGLVWNAVVGPRRGLF